MRALLKDTHSLVHLHKQSLVLLCDNMAGEVWILTMRSAKPALHLFGMSMMLNNGRCCSVVRDFEDCPLPRRDSRPLAVAAREEDNEGEP
jgi:hypothetical protein